jgi:hypothetical protein
MAPASQKQKALFFALAHDLGYPADVVKDRAKQHFDLPSFTEITTEQLSELIDRLLELQATRAHGKDQRGVPPQQE